MPKCVLVLTDEIKIFHENDKHDAYRSVTKCIWGQETEISIMDDNLFQSARSKFFRDINDKHDAYRHGTKCIWGQEAQTSPMEFTISNRPD